ncbi:MAG: VacJ family lipoprotein [Campylobacteraceae bacterium]|jgi:phospholipid-binding lipoprotein MlaA|nr:VacJ family lipoprotein [Campylobacteraceae bacterium]
MRLLLFVALLFLLGGCANKNVSPQTLNSQEIDEFEEEFSSLSGSSFDPFEGYNRAMTKFNDAAITYVISPVSKGYKKVVPKGVRVSIGNFFNNLMFPVRFINNILQGKLSNAFSEGGRFIINTTVGFLGFANVATDVYEIEEHPEDFGQTLGFWGVPSGPHIVLPFFGPSNVRDLGGTIADRLADSLTIDSLTENWRQSTALTLTGTVNGMPQIVDMYETLTKDAIDLYPLLKNSYEQRRDALIKE